ncbi:MAG: discoidin domain-containing protein [Saprospiraceae bacterium]|nr:discoidin domain-containing protein [Saprospiraceae bacterium]
MKQLYSVVIIFLLPFVSHAQNERIAIRQSNGVSEFYYTVSNRIFQPRGFNYIQLVQSPNGFYGESELFQPDSHDPVAIDDDFQRMAALGFNAVRVFIDLCRDDRCIADQHGLVPAYIQNIADLLHQAKTYGLSVMLTANWLPDLGGYSGPAHEICHGSGDFEGGNCLIMSAKGVELYQKFFTDLIIALQNSGAPMETIWAYELRNELFLENNIAPFSLSEGMVTTANGQTYNLGSSEEKNQMLQDAFVFWANSTRSAINAVDPEALVCCGFFTPNDPNILRENDPRIVPFKAALERSDLDFFDVHTYAGFHDFQLEAENYRIIDYHEKPVVLGEYGTFLPNASDEYLAAQLSDHWQSDACNYGVQGFLYWTWDRHRTNASNPDDPWSGSDAGAFIAKVLSPTYKIDACSEVLPNTNVAEGKPTSASMQWEEFVSENVVDGNATQTPWIAGSDPPQWVEVDLQAVYELEAIQIVVETGSDDPHFYTHEIQVRRINTEPYRTVHTYAADRVNFEVLTFKPEDNRDLVGVRYVRVFIPQAPGWAALHELRALIPKQRATFDVPAPPILTDPRPSLDPWDGSELSWKNDISNLAATIQIATDSLFVNIVEEQSGVDSDHFDVSAVTAGTPLWFRVRQRNSNGESAWSVSAKLQQMQTGHRSLSKSFDIYPNPARDFLNIDIKGNVVPRDPILLLESTGKTVGSFRLTDLDQGIPIEGLSSGLYILQLQSGLEVFNFRFIKLE